MHVSRQLVSLARFDGVELHLGHRFGALDGLRDPGTRHRAVVRWLQTCAAARAIPRNWQERLLTSRERPGTNAGWLRWVVLA